jgi:peptidyl-prolyl cis-trans isomerase B (cyclophilin B)
VAAAEGNIMTTEPTRDPALAYVPAPARATSGLAVAAFVLGVCGFGIVAVIFGHVALADIRKTDKDGRGLALAGLWLGYIVAAFWTLAILAIVVL